MKLENYGYKEEKIKVRTMLMAELKLGIVQELLRKNYRFVNIKLVNTTLGEVDVYRSTEDFLMSEYNEAYEIDFVSAKEVLIYDEEKSGCVTTVVVLIKETADDDHSGEVGDMKC